MTARYAIAVRARDKVCQHCGTSGNKENPLTVHHKFPKCRGGTDSLDNLELLCTNCHRKEHLDNGGYPQRPRGKRYRKLKRRKERKHKMNGGIYVPCTRCGHPTSIRCFNCEKPVCRDCAIYGKVPEKYGIHHYCAVCTQKLGVRPVRKW